ncbi:MAG TPA: ABC transporter substrate-binding protein, partial [Deinococcales bacterium]|nr:ABC transporter substrate-binding protein [Deinococcales bacterium]
MLVLASGILLGAASATAQEADEIRVALPAEGDTLDPTHMSLTTSFSVATNIYSGLVRYEPGTIDLMPDLAESWETSEDGLTWTFHLRDDVHWHKGYGKLTAQDVVDSFEYMRDPDSSSRWASELGVIDEISAPDDTTVVFTLHRPSAAFLHTVSAFRQGLILNMQALEDFGDEYGRNPVGTGAYTFENWVPGVEVELKANPDFYLGEPEVETATFVVIPDENVRMMALQRGEVDIALGLQNPEIYAQLLEVEGINSGEVTSSTVHGIGFNTRMEPFDDVRVRRALLHALDREAIAEVIWGGLAEPAYSDLAPPYLGHNPDVPRYEYDPELARELLAEAGYPDGFKTTLYWLSTHSTELLGTVRAMWSSIGVEAEVKMVDGGAWISAMGTGEAPMILRLTTRADPHQW